jgi:hypothetical protein
MNFHEICAQVYGMYGEVLLQPYANWALLWINTGDNQNNV